MRDSAAAARLRPASLAFVRSIPMWAWLTVLVVDSALIRFGFARRMVAPWIMVDELVYSELAKSFAATGHFMVRDVPSGSYGFVYPVLISPAYRVFGDVTTAYTAIKAINSLLISLTAVPVYLLARRVLAPGLSLAAAVLALAIPSTLYAGTVMTENAFYPVFMCAVLALALVLERPTVWRQVALLAVCALAFATRAQAVALVPALLTAPLLLAWWDGSGRRGLARYRVLWAVVGGGALLVVVAEIARGRSPADVLGAYSVVGHQHYAVGDVLRWLLHHLAELDLYLGVVPFAALFVLVAQARGLPRPAQAFVAAAVAVSAWLILEVAAFASIPTVERVEERNLFYVAPLFFVALLVWIDRGMPRPRRVAVPVAVAAAALLALLPYTTLIGVQVQSDTLELLPWWWLQDHWITLGQVWIAALALGIALAALFLFVPRRFGVILPVVVLAYYLVTLAPIEKGRHGVRMASLGALFEGVTTGNRNWVDDRVGADTRVAFVWTGRAKAFSLWENEFFNRSVGPVYDLASPLGGGLPATEVHVDRRDGAIRTKEGKPVRASFALTDTVTALDGTQLAVDEKKGVALLRVPGELRLAHLTSGLYPGDTWSGPRATYTRLRCAGGSVFVDLQSDPHLFHAPQTVVARSAGSVVRVLVDPRATPATLEVPLSRGPGGVCRVRFTVTPTAVPARIQHGGKDTRVLGVHFLAFRYQR
ncbi:MAG: glycosyltransferase family 39 protein [Thermoleophilia bacterium]